MMHGMKGFGTLLQRHAGINEQAGNTTIDMAPT
jgi:hypothetical protein